MTYNKKKKATRHANCVSLITEERAREIVDKRDREANASCFIIAPSDNLESIYNNFKNTAMISKSGGGLGFYAGYIRAKGSKLMGEQKVNI